MLTDKSYFQRHNDMNMGYTLQKKKKCNEYEKINDDTACNICPIRWNPGYVGHAHTHTHRLANQMKPQIAVSHRQVNWCQFGGDREVEAITMAKEKEKS